MTRDLNKIRNWLEPLLHVLIWGSLFLFVWHSVQTIGPFRKQDGSIFLPLGWSTGLSMALFYLNALHLIPTFVQTQEYRKYIFWLIILYAAIVFSNSILDQLYSLSLFSTEKEPLEADIMMNVQSKAVILSLSIGYGLARLWIRNQKTQQQLEKDRLSTQLKYLKAQVNPHFLFNTLNMAYASATRSNDAVTADIIEKLSGLMRYMLYESDVEKVPLEKEIRYIDDTVNLQLQRLSPELAEQVNYRVEGDWYNRKIAPMLLIPFVENVFKHGIVLSKRSDIYISITLRDNFLILETKNQKAAPSPKADTNFGIGLKNVNKRLHLLYPNQHKLEIEEEGAYFHVKLQIEITQNP